MFKSILSVCIFALLSLKAQAAYYCSHQEICKLIEKIYPQKLEIINLVNISGDPHEYEPKTDEIKKLLTSSPLIIGPIELQPWMKNIIYQRSKDKNLVTFKLELIESSLSKYRSINREAFSHFWLYPNIYCDFKKQLGIFLKIQVSCDTNKVETLLSDKLNHSNTPIVLAHDALFQLFEKFSNRKLLNLKGSGHHEEVSPKKIKELYSLQSNGPIIFIKEAGIELPNNILKKIRNTDKTILIQTEVNSEFKSNDFDILTKLIKDFP